MSEKFSATLRIGDLNDYIAPSQGCVVSLKANSNSSSSTSRLDKSSSEVIFIVGVFYCNIYFFINKFA